MKKFLVAFALAALCFCQGAYAQLNLNNLKKAAQNAVNSAVKNAAQKPQQGTPATPVQEGSSFKTAPANNPSTAPAA